MPSRVKRTSSISGCACTTMLPQSRRVLGTCRALPRADLGSDVGVNLATTNMSHQGLQRTGAANA
jgi:hypothetical protein